MKEKGNQVKTWWIYKGLYRITPPTIKWKSLFTYCFWKYILYNWPCSPTDTPVFSLGSQAVQSLHGNMIAAVHTLNQCRRRRWRQSSSLPLSAPGRSVPCQQELNNRFVWDQFSGLSHFLMSPAAVSSLIKHAMSRCHSLNKSLCTLSSSTDKQILEAPGEKSPWRRKEEGWHKTGGQRGGCGRPLLPQHCSDSMKPSFSWPTGSTSA